MESIPWWNFKDFVWGLKYGIWSFFLEFQRFRAKFEVWCFILFQKSLPVKLQNWTYLDIICITLVLLVTFRHAQFFTGDTFPSSLRGEHLAVRSHSKLSVLSVERWDDEGLALLNQVLVRLYYIYITISSTCLSGVHLTSVSLSPTLSFVRQ